MAIRIDNEDISRPKARGSVHYIHDDDLTAQGWETTQPVWPFTGAIGRVGVVSYEPGRGKHKDICWMGFGIFPDLIGTGIGVAVAQACVALGFRDYRTLWMKFPRDESPLGQSYEPAYRVMTGLGFAPCEPPGSDGLSERDHKYMHKKMRFLSRTNEPMRHAVAPNLRLQSQARPKRTPNTINNLLRDRNM